MPMLKPPQEFMRRLTPESIDSQLFEAYPSAVLPAAGAFTNPDYVPIPAGARRISFIVRYARGASNGQATFRPEWAFENDRVGVAALHFDATLTAAEPYARAKGYLQQIAGPILADPVAEVTFAIMLVVPAGAVGVRLAQAELGVTASPGTTQVWVKASGLV